MNIRDPTIYSTTLSLIGAFLVTASTSDLRLYGFSIWIVSNLIWVGYFIKTKQYNPAFLFGIYFITACMGVMNNI
jgi:hypothetical protein